MRIETQFIDGFRWPKPYTCAVAIGWHVDGEAGPIGADARNLEHLGARSQAQYGVHTAMPRILAVHERLGVPASFFIPSYLIERYPGLAAGIEASALNHEIAYHGHLHENVFLLSEEDENALFDRQVAVVSEHLDRRLVGWSAPGWGVRESTLANLMRLGLRYDASLMEADVPYFLRRGEKSLVEVPISMVLDDYEIYGVSLFPDGGGVCASAREGYDIYREEFEGLRAYGGLFSTTFHPSILGRPGRLQMYERLLSHMRSCEDVWFATYEEIAAYVQKTYGQAAQAE